MKTSFLATQIEPLEARIAPAVILTFTEAVDGDEVQIVSDKALTAAVTFTATGNPAEILITGAGLDGASLSTVVKRSATGDGLVNIGRIVAAGLDLGVVTVKGDLGKIVCGNANVPLPALQALNVRSMGIFGLETQGGGNLSSSITGNLGALNVAGDVVGALIFVTGKAGTVKIGGDLRGDATMSSGRIQAAGFTSIFIGGDLVPGPGDESGKIRSNGPLGKLTILGSLRGGLDATGDPMSGQIYVNGDAGPIVIGRDIFGAAAEEKAIDIRGNAGPITIRGSVFGGAGLNSGGIDITGNAGPISIGGSITGGGGENSGGIDVGGNAGAITLRGSLLGSGGIESGSIEVAGNVGAIKIGGSVINDARGSGNILIFGSGAGLSIVGDVRGGTGGTGSLATSQIQYFGNCLGSFRLGGSIVGGPSVGSGALAIGKTASAFVGGSIIGGGLAVPGQSAAIGSGGLGLADVPVVTIVGDIVESPFGGGALSILNTQKLTIGGSLVGASSLDPNVPSSNLVFVFGNVGIAKIGGGILGSNTPGGNARDSAFKVVGNVGSLVVDGSLVGGNVFLGGSIEIGGNAKSVKIAGSLTGGAAASTASLSVGGTLTALSIGGSVTALSQNYDYYGGQVVAGKFGSVKIARDLVTGGGMSGGSLPARLAATTEIGSLTIGGTMAGLINAPKIGAVKIGGDFRAPAGLIFAGINGQSLGSLSVGGDVQPLGNGRGIAVSIAGSAGPITIGGDMRGFDTTPARIVVGGTPGTVQALVSLKVGGSVVQTEILAGWTFAPSFNTLSSTNEDATIGPVTVGRDWIASSLIASANPGADMDFGTGDDTPTGTGTPALSRIAAITIKGQVLGTAAAGDHFGFVAQSLGPVKIGDVSYPSGLAPIQLGAIFDDVTVRLV